MLNSAVEPHSGQLNDILQRAIAERAILGNVAAADLAVSRRELYVAAYALIRIGNTVAQHSRQLELVYPGYSWVFWVDLRNELAHQLGDIDATEVWQAVSQRLPDLIEEITGERPPSPGRFFAGARRGVCSRWLLRFLYSAGI